MKTCGNCGWGKPTKVLRDREAINCPVVCDIMRLTSKCKAHKPRIPGDAQAFVICNGRVKVWCLRERGECKDCAFIDSRYNSDECQTCVKQTRGFSYRIVAVEMVEGK